MHNSLDMEAMELLCSLLKPFKDVTTIMSSESSSSISLMRPLLYRLMELSKPGSATDPGIINNVKAGIHHDLEKRFVLYACELVISLTSGI